MKTEITFESLGEKLGRAVKIESEDVERLLTEGIVERLMRENRTPLRIGAISSLVDGQMEKRLYYQVPPRGFNPEKDTVSGPSNGGCYVFRKWWGPFKTGSTFSLTDDQAERVEEIIATERERLDLEGI
jgi:hypothetical protein